MTIYLFPRVFLLLFHSILKSTTKRAMTDAHYDEYKKWLTRTNYRNKDYSILYSAVVVTSVH